MASYLPSYRASLPFDLYQLILLDDRGTCLNNFPKVVTWKQNCLESNTQPLSCESST